MNTVKICVAVVVGFVLGAFVYRPALVKASGSGVIYVKQMNVGTNPDAMTANREAIGFSCAPEATGVECYMAFR